MIKHLVVAASVLMASGQLAQAGVKIRNLTAAKIFYAAGYVEGGIWHSRGWFAIESGHSTEVPATQYIRVTGPSGSPVWFDEGKTNSSANFWNHPLKGFWAGEAASNGNEVYRDGVRTTTTKLKNAGFEFTRFRRYNDGSVLQFGSHWRVSTKTFSFGHSTNGVKPPEYFSHLNNTIIDYRVSVSSSRGVRTWPTWALASNRKHVSMAGLWLEGGPWYDRWSPSYKGTVTLTYTWR